SPPRPAGRFATVWPAPGARAARRRPVTSARRVPPRPSVSEGPAAPPHSRALALVETPDRPATLPVGPPTSDGQRFRILRPHAGGGLGAVFVALDSELNREAALKQILDRHADDPDSRARFLLEAEVTGRLEHPGVVPVYGLGCDAE